MPNYAEYFSQERYKPKYHIGDRVRGFWNKIPFSGTVYIDSCIDGESPPVVAVHSDLPIRHKNAVYQIVRVVHKDISLLK
jgi:hypothetical protein